VEMAEASRVVIEISASAVPVFDGALETAGKGMITPLGKTNASTFGRSVEKTSSILQERLDCLFDPQTSGGLLVAIGKENADAYLEALRESGLPCGWTIGRVLEKGGGKIVLRP